MGWREREKEWRQKDLWRTPPKIRGRGHGWIEHSGRRWVDLSSNDALGLGRTPLTLTAEPGAGASRLVTGDVGALHEVEEALAAWCGFESALLFASGWQANVSLHSALFTDQDRVLSDELNHGSIIDGLRLSACVKEIVPHGDPAEISLRLADRESVAAVVVESLFSVDGDFYPLDRLGEFLPQRDTLLIVDEAHATGIYGPRRQGLWPEGGGDGLIKVITGSKALGAQGGAVLCSGRMRDFLQNFCRGFVYSTGVSPLLAGALKRNLERLCGEDLGQDKLLQKATALHETLEVAGLRLRNSKGSHILTIDYADHDSGRIAHERLCAAGFWCAWLRWPTVPYGRSRLRLSLTTALEDGQIEDVVSTLIV